MAVPKSARDASRGREAVGGAGARQRSRGRGGAPRDTVREVEGTPRTGARRTVMGYVSELPRFLRLLWGLVTDSRVAAVDKLIVAGAIAYIIAPIDLIPDFIPFLGEVDDVYLLVLALRRLMQNAGRTVLLSHWTGDPAELRELNLRKVMMAAAFFLPRRMRRRLRILGKG